MINYNNFNSPYNGEAFIWLAEYNNDYLPEINYEKGNLGYEVNSFKEIKKEELNRFSLIGQGHYFYFDVNTGIFNINDRQIKISYYDKEKNVEYFFDNKKEKYNDIIMYRTAESEYSPSTNVQTNNIIQYSLGYKCELNNFNLRFILHIPINGKSVYMTFRLVSNEDINGEMRIYKNGNLFNRIETDLKENIGKEFTWVVK